MEKVLFPEMPPEKRAEMLNENCDAIEKKGFTRRFTDEEISSMKTDLSEVHITINDIEIEKKSVTEVFNSKLKPLKNTSSVLLMKLKNKAEYVSEDCFKFIDQESGYVGYYNCDGDLIESRPIRETERQKTIFNIAK